MSKVFISGSRRITALDLHVKDQLRTLMAANAEFLIGDAPGVDTRVQEYLREVKYRSVTVYCTGGVPRNDLGVWPLVGVKFKGPSGTRGYFTAKDKTMGTACDEGLLIWDGKSRGTKRNAIQLLEAGKRAVVYLASIGQFRELRCVADMEQL
jgi:hypothetical protein